MGSCSLEPYLQAGSLVVLVIAANYKRFAQQMLLMASVIASVSTAHAVILADADPVEIESGGLLTHIVDWQRQAGVRVEVKLIEAPQGARLLVDQSGELYVNWQTGLDMPDQSVFVLVARDVDTDKVLDTSQLLVVRKPDRVEQIANAQLMLPKLASFDHQYLQIGVPWHLEINVDDISDEPVDILARGLPQGAMMSVAPNGSYDIDWTPSQSQHGRRQFTVRAVNASNSSLFAEQMIMLSVEPAPVPEKQAIDETVNWKTPQLAPLANQIISAGRVVSFQVRPVIADGLRAIIQIDRLPRNASFDENSNGSRTFYWQTSDKDQGEHLFRFMAIHPQSSELRAWREIVIVIGDPSRSSTAPADKLQSSIE